MIMSKRLDKLVELIPECNSLADVGCDHGYVGIEVLRQNKADDVTFIDVSQLSLDKARRNCPEELTDKVGFVCQDGLGNINVDCAVIAGMGGLEIIDILDRAVFPPHMLVLQPNRNAVDVRRRLARDYRIQYDRMICDGGKFYNMIVAELCDEPMRLTELQEEFGITNLLAPTEDFRLYLRTEQTKLTQILKGCNDPKVSGRLSLVEQAIAITGGLQ